MQEEEQYAQLARMRRIATGLLVLMTIVFVLARLFEERYAGLDFVRAFAEAAMIGALADWFAVSALFRHPFGLPIPHTAIIPRNKDRIGASIANFLEHNFITHEVIDAELRRIDFTGVAAGWLRQPDNSRSVARQVVGSMPALLRMVDDEDVGRFLQGRAASALRRIRFAPLLGELLSILIAGGRHQQLFDQILRLAANGLEQNRAYIRQKIHEKSPRWIPKSIDERFFVRLMEEVHKVLEEMTAEDSEWRAHFQQALEDWVARLRSSPESEQKIAAIVNDTLAHPLFRGYIDQVWQDVRQRVLRDAEAEDSKAVALIEQGLRAFADALAQDETVRTKLNAWIAAFATQAVVAQRHTIADLVRRVIEQWDAETVSRKFELYVGKDLQYIRINGTLVGGTVGLLLHVLTLGL
ncbi:MAG TPA: DUF445 domain-containing protein [Oxalicibacterium sp.]|nr:DUF445 domain-containing protein [Oxalicibacterium sp.]